MILAALLVFYVIPSVIYAEIAEAIDGTADLSDSADTNGNSVTPEGYTGILYEVVESREESVKHFHLPDGTYIAAQYPYPVHYYSDGELVDIDNSLSEVSGEFTNPDARIKFSKHITGNSVLFTLRDGNTKVKLSLTGATKGVAGVVTNNSDAEGDTELGRQMNLEKLSSSVIYPDILDGVDLEYVAYSLNVKENIIVKEKKDSYSYSFELALNNLSATLNGDGSISLLTKDGEEKYVIPAPVVFDSVGALAPNDAADYALTDHRNGKYTLTVTASAEWMNSDERVFPITIDPAIHQPTSPSTTYDTYVTATNPSAFYGGSGIVRVGTTNFILWRFSYLPYLPADAYIISASLTYKRTTSPSGSMHLLCAHRITSTWSHTTVTYQDIADGTVTYEETPLDAVIYQGSTSDATWNITEAIREWYCGANSYGVLIKADPDFEYGQGYFNFFSAEQGVNGPAFSISYTCSGGIEGYYPTISQSTSNAGSGSVNLATGNLTFVTPAVSTTDALFSAPVSLVYNSYMAGASYDSYMPKGYKLNIVETVESFSYLDTSRTTRTGYRYLDADGTIHDFTNEISDSVYLDDDGLSLVLTVSSGDIIIFDTNSLYTREFHNISGSSTKWTMTHIEDKNGNILGLSFDSLNRITAVSVMPSGGIATKHISLLYNTEGKLSAIYHVGSKEGLVLRYDASGKRSTMDKAYGSADITDSDWLSFAASDANDTKILESIRIYHLFDGSGYLTAAFDMTSVTGIQYTVTGSKITAVSDATMGGQSLGITYGQNYSLVTTSGSDDALNTSDDILTYYVFDERGRATNIYSTDKSGEKLYGAKVGTYDDGEQSKNNIKTQAALGGSAVNYLRDGDFAEYPSVRWTYINATRKSPFSELGTAWVELNPTATAAASLSQNVSLLAGTYTLSMKMVTNYIEGVRIKAVITALDDSGFSFSETMPSTDIEYFTATFTLPTDSAVEVKIKAEYKDESFYANNVVMVADVMLERGENPSQFSMLEYGGFDVSGVNGEGEAAAAITDAWSGTYTIEDTGGVFGNALKINPSYSIETVEQIVYTASDSLLNTYDNKYYNYTSNVGGKYILSAFAKNESGLSVNQTSVYAKIVYYRGAEKTTVTKIHEIDFSNDISAWQFGSIIIDTADYDSNGNALDCIKSISIICEASTNPFSPCYFDNISLVDANKLSYDYEYSENGLLLKKSHAFWLEYYTYNSMKLPEWIVDSYGNMQKNTYDEVGNIISSTVYKISTSAVLNVYLGKDEIVSSYFNELSKSAKSQTVYSYNEYGQLLSTVTSQVSGTNTITVDTSKPPIETYYEYITTPGSYIFGALSENGVAGEYATGYFYNENNGRLLATIDLNTLKGVSYTYDDMGRMTGVTPASVTSGSATSYTPETGAENATYTYDWCGYLDSISTDSTTYTFNYDVFGKQTGIGVGDSELATYEYNDHNGKLKKVTYGNGFVIEYVYDDLENIKEIWYTEDEQAEASLAYSYEYTAYGNLSVFKDHREGWGEIYSYDNYNRLLDVYRYNLDEEYMLFNIDTYYGINDSRIASQTVEFGYGSLGYTDNVRYSYNYNIDGSIRTLDIYGDISASLNYTYDKLGRVTRKNLSSSVNTPGISTSLIAVDIEYASADGYSTSRVSSYTNTIVGDSTDNSYYYYYGDDGNISSISSRGDERYDAFYFYDNLGQLIRADYAYTYLYQENYSEIYEYDDAGNLLSIRRYEYCQDTPEDDTLIYEKVYTYGNSAWGDQLTAFNGVGITYDEIGNPLSYYNGRSYTFSWTGRQLTSATVGGKTYTYTYDSNGLRTSKTVDGVTTRYYYLGNLLLGEENPSGYTLYLYDDEGLPVGMQYWAAGSDKAEWDTYIFERNLQGDVVGVYTTTGTKLITYLYDAWGNTQTRYQNGGANTTAVNNRLTYRGYYFDTETGFYYVSSRYYDPEIGRWINADSIVAGVGGNVKGYNLFAYCFNNPVNMDDQTGNWPKWIKDSVKWVAKNIVKPVVKTVQKTLSKVDLTYSTGVNVSGTPSAWIFNGQIGVSIDTKGNVAIQASGGGGITGGDPGISITRYQSVTNAPNIDKLNDAYYQVGGSIAVPIEGVPVAAGGDVMFMPDSELNTGYFGLTGNVGLGTPGKEFHVEWGTTVTLPYTQFNIYEVARSVYIKIMEW